jgi:hypothetical protein
VLLLILGLIQAVAIDQPAESIRSLLGCALLYIAFLIVDLLKTYIFEMRFDWRIAFVCGMLYVFLILYALYFFINGIKCLASRADLEEIGGVKRKSTEYTDGYRVDMTELSETDELEDAEDTP